MRVFVDGTLRAQMRAFSLRACCEDCVHFDATATRCSLEYPNDVHRAAHHASLEDGAVILFCKTFEVD